MALSSVLQNSVLLSNFLELIRKKDTCRLHSQVFGQAGSFFAGVPGGTAEKSDKGCQKR